MAAPLFTPNNSTNPCNNYSTQLIPSQNGQDIIQIANRGCRMLVAKSPLNNPVAQPQMARMYNNGFGSAVIANAGVESCYELTLLGVKLKDEYFAES